VAGGLTVGGFGPNSGEHRDGEHEHSSVADPDTWAELLRWFQAVGLQRIGVPAAAGLGSKQGKAAAAIRFSGAARLGWGGPRGRREIRRADPGSRDRVAAERIRRSPEISETVASGKRGEGEDDGEAGRWGH
jgi:hypothetical protein